MDRINNWYNRDFRAQGTDFEKPVSSYHTIQNDKGNSVITMVISYRDILFKYSGYKYKLRVSNRSNWEKVWNMFKAYNQDTRTTSMTSMDFGQVNECHRARSLVVSDLRSEIKFPDSSPATNYVQRKALWSNRLSVKRMDEVMN